MNRAPPITPGLTISRGGFTLVELLVATGLFVLGFSVCLGLFLAGMRHRTAAEDHLRLGLASSSLVEEIGLGRPGLPTTDRKPKSYVGRGGLTGGTDDPNHLYAVPQHRNTWFRVLTCQNAVVRSDAPAGYDPKDDELADALLTDVLVVSFAAPVADPADPILTFDQIQRRLRVPGVPATNLQDVDRELLMTYLTQRQLAVRMQTVILRRAP